ncbi:MAG TPA: cytochrome c [Acetobacteraceae bacterium]
MLAAALAFVAAGVGAAYAEGFDPIASRQAGQDLLAGDFSGINAVVKANGSAKTLEKPAAALARWMHQFPTLFPPGSDKGDNTKAKPEIWSDPAGFNKAADDFVAQANKLVMLAKADDAASMPAQVKAVGAACVACHKKFKTQ